MITVAYGRLLSAAGICGAGLIAGLLIQQPRVNAAKAATALAIAECERDKAAMKVASLELLVSGERAAREALAKAQEKAQEATDEYHKEVDRISAAVDGLPRRVSRLCQQEAGPGASAAGGGGSAQAGDPASAAGRVVRGADGAAAGSDFDARPWREFARQCEAVASGLRACLR